MELKNCTPHNLNIQVADGSFLEIKPSGIVPRLEITSVKDDEIDGIPVYMTKFGDVYNLPPEQDDVCLIVSRIVLDASRPDRIDIFSPGEPIRDSSGRIVGCKGLHKKFLPPME
jgi:hypothetical protein